MTGVAKQAFEVDFGFRSSNDNISLMINNERSKRATLVALADIELEKISDATVFISKSIRQIILDTGIPHTTAYRKIRSD